MPVDPNAADRNHRVPLGSADFAAGLVRDLRIRWALEEIGRDYRVRLLDAMNPRPEEYFAEQPFGQVPVYRDGEVQLFESGAILIHLGLNDERLLPARRERPDARHRLAVAALNSVEPMIFELVNIDIFNAGEEWAKERRPQVVEKIRKRGLSRCWPMRLATRTGSKGRFTIGDLMMVTVLRNLRHTDLVAEQPKLAAFVARGEARPAFQRALADQLAVFEATSTRRRSSMTYFEGFVVPVPEANKEAYRKSAADVRAGLQGVRRHAPCRGVGQRRVRGQGHRLPHGGRSQGRREGRLLLVRISGQGNPRRRQREDAGPIRA